MTASTLILLAAAAYLLAASRDRRGWSPLRTGMWLAGCAAAALAAALPLAVETGPILHMAQHLLLGMAAPIGLVLGAPVTLLLRTGAPAVRRGAVRLLRSRPLRVLSHPFTAMVLSVGGLYAIMLTPAHTAAAHGPLPHGLLLAHYLAAGYLFTWSIIGPDPAPHRPGTATRAAALAAAIAAHAFLAKYLYAHALPHGHDPETARAAARLMYYGGDAAELVLACILFGTWYRRRARAAGRRAAPPRPAVGRAAP